MSVKRTNFGCWGCSWVISLLWLILAIAVCRQHTGVEVQNPKTSRGIPESLRWEKPSEVTESHQGHQQSMSPGATSTTPPSHHRPFCPLGPLATTPIKRMKAFLLHSLIPTKRKLLSSPTDPDQLLKFKDFSDLAKPFLFKSRSQEKGEVHQRLIQL